MNRTRYVIGNWKLNTSLKEAENLLKGIDSSSDHLRVGVAPPYPWIVPLRNRLDGGDIWIGAQHAVPTPLGAFTGDISVAMIAPHVDFVLIGHSEQRQYHPADTYGEAVAATLSHGKTAILCIGENLEQRRADMAKDVVANQLAACVPSDFGDLPGELIIAYEPVWAIGTGQAATSADAETMAKYIDQWFFDQYQLEPVTIPILYGGSANAANAAEFLRQPHIGGLLVGSASLNAESFNAIISALEAMKSG